jgi:hypothetical protein
MRASTTTSLKASPSLIAVSKSAVRHGVYAGSRLSARPAVVATAPVNIR